MSKNKKVLKALLFLVLAPGFIFAQKFDLKNIDTGEMLNAGKDLIKAVKPMSEDEEIALGREVAARLAGTFGVWKDRAWTERINIIGRTLALYSERPDIKYRFAILDTEEVNAYSAPGGYIFVTRGLLKQVKSEAELAGVLAHEIGHIAKKHIVKEIQKSNLWQTGTRIAIASGELSSEQQKLLDSLTDQAWDTLVVKGLSKEDEYEADRVGAINAEKLGYDPYGLYNFIKNLEALESKPGDNLKHLLSTHPSPGARLAELEKLYQKQGFKQGALPDFPQRYAKFLSRNPLK
jgi:predicted Zn-dependent protease